MDKDILIALSKKLGPNYTATYLTAEHIIYITDDNYKPLEDRSEGWTLATGSDYPINHKGHVYFIIDLNESDPDTMEGINELKKMLDVLMYKEISRPFDEVPDLQNPPLQIIQFAIIGNHSNPEGTSGGMLVTGPVVENPEGVRRLKELIRRSLEFEPCNNPHNCDIGNCSCF